MEITYLKPFVFYAFFLRHFLTGLDIFIIVPTAWYYVKSLGQNITFFGIVMSAYQLNSLWSSPIIGKLADKFGHYKCIIVVSMFLRVISYVIYSIPVSAYFPLAGRLLAGFSSGCIGVIFGQITLYTPKEHRAQIFIMLDGILTLGTLFGPTVGVFFTFNANILGWKIDAGNSPGIVCGILWFGMFVISLWLPDEFGTMKVADDNDDDVLETQDSNEEQRYGSYSQIFLIFYLVILSLFYSNTTTIYVPLLAQDHFHLQLVHVKMLFLVCSLFSMVLFILFYIAAKYYHETQLLICSMLIQLTALTLLSFIAFSWDIAFGVYGGYILFPYICLGMPFFSFSLGCSLLSKITHQKDAAFYQSSSVAALQLGYLLGRLTASNIFAKTSLLWFCLAQFLSWTLGAVWFALEYPSLRRAGANIA
ncbi:uncharacterized protein LOC114533378 [Dendronephthya gigantea]|uniref:uncharacterized protein LOC114533378 n=1 Tax=Dendronephthya gigantea TaxID=151771 RepID=UPI00106C98F0|nr:uncharacterized protein LOC114533378 [Dendronephthya gigantea]XP_028410691.1 uncharacterized protein LOC114533378 [Dendronephthya gigantea]XP_028410692.1 uncharacterized protein LOC114533378 [Dendronephthya gigantea]XP_028410693.1 uncharacterized protein LOC114533378 [Dendronephthya gigantea]XP_028410694.1 uncharacterized protein LOC114533378 [Dendronephthya gigantea]XP_028410695.1 uncharacterized protein LOC114533378 [Dendronephthya gigantea]